MTGWMSHKSHKIAVLIESLQGRELDAHYLGYFECFNRQLFFEAHEVLEELWLAERGRPEDLFYKGLIQLAGAFVHLQKERAGPAAALFRLAQHNLQRYPSQHQRLDVSDLLSMISSWLQKLQEIGTLPLALNSMAFPKLSLRKTPGDRQAGE